MQEFHIQMVVLMQKFQRGGLVYVHQIARAEQQEVFRIFNAILFWTHWVCGISKIVFKFLIIELTETDSQMSHIG